MPFFGIFLKNLFHFSSQYAILKLPNKVEYFINEKRIPRGKYTLFIIVHCGIGKNADSLCTMMAGIPSSLRALFGDKTELCVFRRISFGWCAFLLRKNKCYEGIQRQEERKMADFEKMYFELFNGITMLLNNSKSFSKRLKSSILSTKKKNNNPPA